jgi:hypothetical protein
VSTCPPLERSVGALSEDGVSLLISDGDGVYHTWLCGSQSYLAYRMRVVWHVAERTPPALGTGGTPASVL